MDSPLLPTHRQRPLSSLGHSQLAEDPSLLADLSIEEDDDSFLPSSPVRASSSRPQPSQLSAQDQRSASVSSSRSASRFCSVSIASSTASDTEETPQKAPVGRAVEQGPTFKPRFSLFAPPRPPSVDIPEDVSRRSRSGSTHGRGDEERAEGEGEDDEEGEEGADQTIHAGQRLPHSSDQPISTADRDDKLRESLYELRRMNEVFDGFLGALEAARGHNERLAVRVKQTSALLDQYTSLLGQAEHTQKLLSNPNWTGAHDDAAAMKAEHAAQIQAEEARQREAEEAAEAARRAEEDKERRIAEAERARESGRGVGAGRGRGVVRGGTRGGRGLGIPVSSTARPGSKTATTGIRKPSVPSTASTGSGGSGGATGTGKYGHVASSGYGPPGRR